MTLYEFMVPLILAVPAAIAVLWLHYSAKHLDDKGSKLQPGE